MENLYKKKKNPLSKLQSPTLIDKSAKKKKKWISSRRLENAGRIRRILPSWYRFEKMELEYRDFPNRLKGFSIRKWEELESKRLVYLEL